LKKIITFTKDENENFRVALEGITPLLSNSRKEKYSAFFYSNKLKTKINCTSVAELFYKRIRISIKVKIWALTGVVTPNKLPLA